MKLFLLLPLLISFNVYSQDWAAGFILGAPTGLSGLYKIDQKNSIDAALAFDLSDDNDIQIHSTYLWTFPNYWVMKDFTWGWYAGAGIKLRTYDRDREDDFRMGPRVSAGLNHFLKMLPELEFFLEGSFSLHLIPKTDGDFDVGLGARYYF